MLFWQSRLPSRSMYENWMNCDVKNRTPVPRGTDVLFDYVRWSADESDFRERLAASMFVICFGWSIKADIHFGLIAPRRMPAFVVVQFI